MEINFTPLRFVILILLLAGFWWLGGFIPPSSMMENGYHSGADRSWLYCVLMFLCGATGTTIVDHHVGTIDRTNLRLAYVIAGIVLMTASCLWLRGIQETVRTESMETAWCDLECGEAHLSAALPGRNHAFAVSGGLRHRLISPIPAGIKKRTSGIESIKALD